MAEAVAVLSALPLELRGVRRWLGARAVAGLAQRWEADVGGRRVVLCAGGVGREAAEAAASVLCDENPRYLLAVGLAGGLDPSLGPGTVVLPRVVRAGPPARWQGAATGAEASCDPQLAASIYRSLSGRALACVTADCLTVGAALRTPAAKRDAWNAAGAGVCDMESYWIADVAARHRVPFAAVRVVADPAWRSLPPYLPADGRLSATDLLAGLARRPWTVAALGLLALDVARATRALDRALIAWCSDGAQ